MPKVIEQKRSARGPERRCGRPGCGREILRGEKYYIFSFRYGGKHFRCSDHYPRRSELTQSKMSAVYAAIEEAEDNLGSLEEIKAAIEQVAETSREVVDEYREAAEHFGGAGQSAETADELEGWVDELEQFDPEESESEFDEEGHDEEAKERAKDEDALYSEAMQAIRYEWEEAHEEATESARAEAQDLLSNCPL